MIAVLDYGAGNLRSVQNTLDVIGAKYEIVTDAAGLRRGAKVLLPGVGNFGQMMRALDRLEVRETLRAQIAAGVPFFGICLGLQALFERSAEAPETEGLGVFAGSVQRFPVRSSTWVRSIWISTISIISANRSAPVTNAFYSTV